MTTVAERVAAGVAYLDEREPGWAAQIDLEVLDLSDCDRCVIGQLYPGINDTGRIDTAYDPDLGFDAPATVTSARATGAAFAALDAEWKRVITERRTLAGTDGD
jgi:hypothetical protein